MSRQQTPTKDQVCWDASSAILEAQTKENQVLQQILLAACDSEDGDDLDTAAIERLLDDAIDQHREIVEDLELAKERLAMREGRPAQR